jgi:hypothetical protein
MQERLVALQPKKKDKRPTRLRRRRAPNSESLREQAIERPISNLMDRGRPCRDESHFFCLWRWALDVQRWVLLPKLFPLYRQHLSPAIITAARANGMGHYRTPALRTLIQGRGVPAVRRLPRPQPHFRSFAFRDSHVWALPKQQISEKQAATTAAKIEDSFTKLSRRERLRNRLKPIEHARGVLLRRFSI